MSALDESTTPWLRDTNRFVDGETRVCPLDAVDDDGATVHMDVPRVPCDRLDVRNPWITWTAGACERPNPYGDDASVTLGARRHVTQPQGRRRVPCEETGRS